MILCTITEPILRTYIRQSSAKIACEWGFISWKCSRFTVQMRDERKMILERDVNNGTTRRSRWVSPMSTLYEGQ